MMITYIILDPNFEYADYMVRFLNEYDYKGIAVFTEANSWYLFHSVYINDMRDCIIDEYLIDEFPDLQTFAATILEDHEDDDMKGIIPWDERSIEFGAQLGDLLDLDWNSHETIHRFRNKYALKEYLRQTTDIRINASAVVSTVEQAIDFVESLDSWPVVVKPTEGSGSRGVFFAYSLEELLEDCSVTFATDQGEILLEEYIGGLEYVVNGITNARGDILITDVWNYDKRESHGIENLYFQTIKIDRADERFDILAEYAAAVIEALQLRKSPFHMELKLDDDGPCLVECGARFAGGNQPLLASMLHEHSLFEIAAAHYLEAFPFQIEDLHFEKYDRSGARIIKGVQSEEIRVVEMVHGIEEVQELPSFAMIGFIRPPGSYLPVTTDLLTASYEIYLLHEDREQIEYDAQRVRELIWFE